jgi:DNA-directed RNA polymerase specialized sigma24 family protein
VLTTQSQITSLNDLELAIALCATTEDTLLFNEFVRRFRKDLEAFCQAKCKVFKLDTQIGSQICNESLERVRAYKSFNKNKATVNNARGAVLVFLCRIATNRFLTYSKKEKKSREDVHLNTYFDGIFEQVEPHHNVEDSAWKRDMALKILKKLNQKEQKVVLTDIEHKKHSRYLPDEVTEFLATELGVKKDTIRKIRERALQKIKTIINEINQQ